MYSYIYIFWYSQILHWFVLISFGNKTKSCPSSATLCVFSAQIKETPVTELLGAIHFRLMKLLKWYIFCRMNEQIIISHSKKKYQVWDFKEFWLKYDFWWSFIDSISRMADTIQWPLSVLVQPTSNNHPVKKLFWFFYAKKTGQVVLKHIDSFGCALS